MPEFNVDSMNRQVVADAWDEHEKIVNDLEIMRSHKISEIKEKLAGDLDRKSTRLNSSH